jgi:type IV secretion system protein TrbL
MTLAVGLPDPFGIGGTVVDVIAKAAGSIFDLAASEIAKAVEAATAGVGTAWIRIGTPDMATADGHASPVVAFLHSELAPYGAAVMVLSIILGATRMAVEMRGEPGRDILIGLLTWVAITGAGATVVGTAIELSNAAAEHILSDSLHGDTFGKHMAAMLAVGGITAPIAAIVIGSLAFLTCLLQMVLMIARAGLLVVMVGMLPFVASAAATKTGRSWLERYMTWLLAFILYLPVAAVIYATGFRLVDSGEFNGQGLLASVVGFALLVCAVAALPALMRIVAPAASAAAGGDIGRRAVAVLPYNVRNPGVQGARMMRRGPTGARRTP